MSAFISPYDPSILKQGPLNAPLNIFLCGPGYESTRYDFRQKIRNYLTGYPNVKIVLGEELDVKRHGLKKTDLQTAEMTYAQMVDFTVLLLESPGAIAELGTFSMMPHVRPRLFVMVPDKFFESKSYIARGPLSVIASEHVNNIIYFNETRQTEAIASLQLPLTLFKYAKTINPFFDQVRYGYTKSPKGEKEYVKAFDKAKQRFIDMIVLISINMLQEATFPMLIGFTRFDPAEVRQAIGRLFKAGSITKKRNTYSSSNGYSDEIFEFLNTTFLSKMKSVYLAAA